MPQPEVNKEKPQQQIGHTVEKVGGTSMSRVDQVMNNVFLRDPDNPYQRIFVVSAYGGVTDRLLEHKRTGQPGVFALFCAGDDDEAWQNELARVAEHLCTLNAQIFDAGGQLLQKADQFIRERIEQVRICLLDLQNLCSFGHFRIDEHLNTVREMLAAIGEAHSAHNTALLLQARGTEACFIDLTGWGEPEALPLDEILRAKMSEIDLNRQLPIVTGYAKCAEGLMKTYDRGYSEITLSRLAVVTGAREAIIHKEYHLSSADPRIVGPNRAVAIGRTNYDVADQLAILGMEAIHPGAAQSLRKASIPLRVRHSFEPEHRGTLIDSDYLSETPCVEIITGRKGVYALEVFNHDMLGVGGHALGIQRILDRFKVRNLTRESNANSITHYIAASPKVVKRIQRDLEELFPEAQISERRVAVVSAIGSNLNVAGLLSECVSALAVSGINILAVHQSLRAIDMRFVVEEQDFEDAVAALHDRVIQPLGKDTIVANVA